MRRDLLYNTCVLSVCMHSELESCHLYETRLWAVGPVGWETMEDSTATVVNMTFSEVSLAAWLFDGFKVSLLSVPSRCMSHRALTSQLYKCLQRHKYHLIHLSVCIHQSCKALDVTLSSPGPAVSLCKLRRLTLRPGQSELASGM